MKRKKRVRRDPDGASGGTATKKGNQYLSRRSLRKHREKNPGGLGQDSYLEKKKIGGARGKKKKKWSC